MTTTRFPIASRILMVTVAAVAVALAVAVGLAAAGALDGESDGLGAAPPSQPDRAPDPDVAPDTPGPLPDGRHVGRIVAAYDGPPELVFDRMELFVGEAAVDAARQDGRPAGEDGDFYLRDTEGDTVSLPVDGAVAVTVVDCSGGGCEEGAPVEYGAFTRMVAGDDTYWLTVADGWVVGIHQQYLP